MRPSTLIYLCLFLFQISLKMKLLSMKTVKSRKVCINFVS